MVKEVRLGDGNFCSIAFSDIDFPTQYPTGHLILSLIFLKNPVLSLIAQSIYYKSNRVFMSG